MKTVTVAELFAEIPRVSSQHERRKFMNPDEPDVLVSLIASVSPRAVLELGVNEGLTAKDVLQLDSIQRYVGVDVPRDYVPSKKCQRREVPTQPGHAARGDPRFSALLRPRGSLDLTPSDVGSFDAVFIDGDHGRAAVENDTELALHITRPGGIIVWHDYNDGPVDVKAVLDEGSYAGLPLTHVAGTWLVYLRVPA